MAQRLRIHEDAKTLPHKGLAETQDTLSDQATQTQSLQAPQPGGDSLLPRTGWIKAGYPPYVRRSVLELPILQAWPVQAGGSGDKTEYRLALERL